MSPLIIRARTTAAELSGVVAHDKTIRPNLTDADHVAIAALMYVLIANGVDTVSEITGYLTKRNCDFDRATLRFILTVFNGGDRRHNLWRRDQADRYALLAE